VQDERIRREYAYMSWLARCYINNGKPREAWELHANMDTHETFNMLNLIANDCYKSGAFYYSAKAYDMLDRLDPSSEYWPGKRGACCGVFQQVVALKEDKDVMREVIQILRQSTGDPQAELIVRIMMKWANENGVDLVGIN
jgi:intraflagellar transport protein 56